MDCNPQGFSVHGILQARILEWVAMPSFREYSRLRDQTLISYVPCIGRQVLYHEHHLGSPQLQNVLQFPSPIYIYIYTHKSFSTKLQKKKEQQRDGENGKHKLNEMGA